MDAQPPPADNVAVQVAKAFGGVEELRGAVGCPYTTAYSWTKKGVIPSWRKPAILAAALDRRITLPAEFVAA